MSANGQNPLLAEAIDADEAAAVWDARLRAADCTEEERAQFRAWRDAKPEHRQAFEDLQALLGGLRDEEHSPEIRAMREAALGAANRGRNNRFAFWGAGIAASFALIAVAFGVFLQSDILPNQNRDDRIASASMDVHPFFATAVGERSTVTLDDGTIATLNTDTRIRVDYAENERLVTLIKGQALFDVAKNPNRPFVVAAGTQRIVAVGTIFDVKFIAEEVEVTMLEGEVDVFDHAGSDVGAESLSENRRSTSDNQSPNQTIARLKTGQQLIASASFAAPEIRETDAERATIWREGRVFFEDTSLIEAIAEMNRYSTTVIVVDDQSLDQFRVNGMFKTGQQTNFVDAIESYFPVDATQNARGEIVIKMSRRG